MSALPLYALDTGVIRPVEATGEAQTRMRIFNTNTSVITDASMRTVMTSSFSSSSSASYPEWYSPADTEIPGVMGQFPGVELSLRDPVRFHILYFFQKFLFLLASSQALSLYSLKF